MSLEVAGRKARYGTFHRIKKEYQLDRIALGQHGDDNAETIIMRMIRGTGPKGLSGIPPLREDGVIRPYYIAPGRRSRPIVVRMAWFPGWINQLRPIYFRNRVRLEIIPIWKGIMANLKQPSKHV